MFISGIHSDNKATANCKTLREKDNMSIFKQSPQTNNDNGKENSRGYRQLQGIKAAPLYK